MTFKFYGLEIIFPSRLIRFAIIICNHDCELLNEETKKCFSLLEPHKNQTEMRSRRREKKLRHKTFSTTQKGSLFASHPERGFTSGMF